MALSLPDEGYSRNGSCSLNLIYMYKVLLCQNCIGVVMVNLVASSAVDRGFEPRLGQAKGYGICICCFSIHTSLRSNSKDGLSRNQDNMSKWSDMSTIGLLFQGSSPIQTQLHVSVLTYIMSTKRKLL